MSLLGQASGWLQLGGQPGGQLEEVAAAVLAGAARQMLYSSILFLLVLPINAWLLRRGSRRTAALRSALWGLVLLRLLLPPELALPGSAGDLWGRLGSTLRSTSLRQVQLFAGAGEAFEPHHLAAAPAVGRGASVLLALWITGVAVSGGLWWSRRRAACRLAAAGRAVEEPWILAAAERWRRRLGLARPVRLVAVEAAVAPFTLGTRAPVVVLPRLLLCRGECRGEPWLVESTLAHELAHVRHRDDLRLLLTQGLLSIWFFHPVVRWVVGRLAAERERLSDARVLERGVIPPRAYGRSLLAVSRLAVFPLDLGGRAAAPAFLLPRRSLTMRIHEIVREGSTPSPRTTPALAVALAAGLFLLPMAPLPAASSTAGPAAALAASAPAWDDPVPGARVSSPYGARVDPFDGGSQMHRGIDLAAPRGTEILAPAAGTVRVATSDYEGGAHHGTVVVLDHDGGLSSFYSHLDRLDVRAGQAVTAGQVLGTVGVTGETTGAHLHFEVWRRGSPIDPAQLVAAWQGR